MKLTNTVAVESFSTIADPYLVLIGAVTESGIEEQWQSLDVLDFVQRECASENINLSEGDDEVNLTFTIDGEVNIENSDLVVFVQSQQDSEIYNGNELRVANTIEPSNTIAQNILEGEIYPNPTTDKINVLIDDKYKGT